MNPPNSVILTINGGSSSIKLSVYEMGEEPKLLLSGKLENMGTPGAAFGFTNIVTGRKATNPAPLTNPDQAAGFLIDWLEKQDGIPAIHAIGHRMVHGMHHSQPERITTELLAELKRISPYDPDHLPAEIKLIEVFATRYPALPQVACFDTSFHASMPAVAKLLPIARKYRDKGIQRYGFHGISYAYLMNELSRVAGEDVANGKIILAHLGSGASIAAVNAGKSIDTSMGFTATSGLPMSTRTGDLDPGVAWYLMAMERLNPQEFNRLINHESGLLAVSETSSDMRELLKAEPTDNRAGEAIELFCYQAKKWIGSFAAALGGLETLVFSGGIGEHIPEVRKRICDGLQFLGIELDDAENEKSAAIISSKKSRITVRVIPTNEEVMIAKLAWQTLNRAG